MNKILAFLDVFRKGAIVADPTTWKNWQMGLNAVVPLLVALGFAAEQMGWLASGTTAEAIALIGSALVAIGNVGAAAATSRKVGIGPKPPMPEPNDAELYDYANPVPPNLAGDEDRAITDRADEGRRVFGVD